MVGFYVLFVLGTLSGLMLYRNMRFLAPASTGDKGRKAQRSTISVIIPMRNEAHNIPLLLKDLFRQSLAPLEVICVDDASEDDSAKLAQKEGAKTLCVTQKPFGWMGKSYACHVGASSAKGEYLLFLDADVRLEKHALMRIFSASQKQGGVVSVHPLHTAKRFYEQLCLFFNMIAAAALACPTLLGRQTHGLFGPVIFIPVHTYKKCGGHSAVRGSILDDISLGRCLGQIGEKPYCCMGDAGVSYRMYSGGVRSMLQGWTKNFASGAKCSSFTFFVLVFLWVSALANLPLQLILAAFRLDVSFLLVGGIFYLLLCVHLFAVARKIGTFRTWILLLYPIPLVVFLFVFCLSTIKKVFRRPVRWKGRDVLTGD